MIFHIIWKEDERQLVSTGGNFEGKTAKEAVQLWSELFPNKYFYAMHVKEDIPFQFYKREVNPILPSIKRPKKTTKNFLTKTFSFTKNEEDGN